MADKTNDDGNKVLIVDDQQGIRLLLSEILQQEGYHPLQAANGTQAPVRIEREHPKLMLLDVNIPGMNGIELLKKTKQENPDLKAIVITGFDDSEMVQNARNLGAIAHFLKPFDIEKLMRTVKKELPLKQKFP